MADPRGRQVDAASYGWRPGLTDRAGAIVRDMASRPFSPWQSVALVLLLLLGVGLLLAALASVVLMAPAGVVVAMVLGAVLLLGAQLLLFRALGLRSRADEPRRREDDDGRDWRAWRG